MRRTNTTGQLRPLRDRLSASQQGRREERIISRIGAARASHLVRIPSLQARWFNYVQRLFSRETV